MTPAPRVRLAEAARRPTDGIGRWAVLGAAAAATALVATAGSDDGPVLCPFRRCTGGYCPGCGVSRGANRLVRGDLLGAWQWHPWVIVAAAQLVVIGGVLVPRGAPDRRALVRRMATPLLVVNAATMLVIWVVRLSAGAIPRGWF